MEEPYELNLSYMTLMIVIGVICKVLYQLIIYCTISNNSGYDAVLKVTEAYSGPRDEGRSSYRMKFTLESSLITNNKLLNLKLMDLVSQEKASMSSIRFFNLKDCRFTDNIVSANHILGLLVDSQSLELFGINHFVGNKGKLGGALFIRNGKIILHKNSNIIIEKIWQIWVQVYLLIIPNIHSIIHTVSFIFQLEFSLND